MYQWENMFGDFKTQVNIEYKNSYLMDKNMDKLQVYLKKQQRQQKQALQRVKTRMSSSEWELSYDDHKMKQTMAKGSIPILFNRREGSKQVLRSHQNASYDEKKMKHIYLSTHNNKSQLRQHAHNLSQQELQIHGLKKSDRLVHSSYQRYRPYLTPNPKHTPNHSVEQSSKLKIKGQVGKRKREDAKYKRSRSASSKKEKSLKHLDEKDTEDMKKKADVELKFEAMWRTRKGTQIMNPNKVNQDRVLVEESIGGLDLDLYAVADGHGVFGHHVSHSLLTNLTQTLLHQLKYEPTLRKVLKQGYNDLQSHLENNPDMNAECSGSTLVTVLLQQKKRVICANVGDSRAIIGRQIDGSNWEVVRLSNDHKPSVDREKRRILRAGGRVEKIKDEDGNTVGPSRVWLPKKQMQGLAMSRSMGDNISKGIGVIHEPEMLSHQLSPADKFMLIASDGVWQFLTNYQILNIVIPYYRQGKLEQACEKLLKAAYDSWTTEDNSIIDDISFILVFIKAT